MNVVHQVRVWLKRNPLLALLRVIHRLQWNLAPSVTGQAISSVM